MQRKFDRASQLIEHLEDLIRDHGDLPIELFDIEGNHSHPDMVYYKPAPPTKPWKPPCFFITFEYQENKKEQRR